MKETDKFLVGIVSGIVILVVATFVVVLRQPEPTFQTEDTPEGVAQNYLLAIQQGDYQRAQSYLSPELPGYPDNVAEFTSDVENNRWNFRLDTDVSLIVDSTTIDGDKAAVVMSETQYYGRGLFGTDQSSQNFTVSLIRAGDTWKIKDSSAYWDDTWEKR